jgi:hypothetical protein
MTTFRRVKFIRALLETKPDVGRDAMAAKIMTEK